MIPRRVCLNVLAGVLERQVAVLGRRTPGGTAFRRDRIAAEDSAAKQAGREDQVARSRRRVGMLTQWIADPVCYHGPGLDADVLGLLAALATGHTADRKELERRLGQDLYGIGGETVVDLLQRMWGLP